MFGVDFCFNHENKYFYGVAELNFLGTTAMVR